MKKLFGIMLAVGFLSGLLCAGGDQYTKGAAKDKKAWKEMTDQEKADACEDQAKNFEKKAEKTVEKGNAQLGELFKKCADAKRKMGKAIAAGDKDSQQAAKKEFEEAIKALNEAMPKKDQKDQPGKDKKNE